MGKSSKAPEYASTKVNSGYWGTSTNNKNGTTYKTNGNSSWIGNTMDTVGNNLNSTLNNMLSNDYSNDANFQAYQNQLNKTAQQNYDTSVLGNLSNRGLMRSTSLQKLNNDFSNELIDNTTDLYDNYYNRQANNLSNLLNTSNNLYNYMTGVSNLSNSANNNVNSYNQWKYQQDSANNTNLYKILSDSAAIAGTAAKAAMI